MSFSELFSTASLLGIAGISVLSGVLLFFASLKFLLALQQCGYRGKRYFKWLTSPETPYLSRLMLLCILGFLFFLVLGTNFAPIVGENAAAYVGFASFALFTALYIRTESAVNAKVPLKKTKRLVRLCITFAFTLTVFVFGLMLLCSSVAIWIGDEIVWLLRYSLICGVPILLPYLLFVAYLINEPMEEFIKRHYIRQAKTKLESSNVLRIGITGSYGKTSVKEILKTILSQKYRVLATPASYNTPLGIAITVKSLDSTHDVFLAEMGARNKGDIKELALLVKPDYGVLTGINNQHLESFGTIENIKNTKFELFENLAQNARDCGDGLNNGQVRNGRGDGNGRNGKGFFSSDNEGARELYERFGGEKYFAGINGAENDLVTATELATSEQGTSFTLNIAGEKPVACSTVLLGRHSVSNICLAAAVAYKVGLTPEEIAKGINRLQSVGHRLELVPNNKKIVIIDDSYNCNEDGAKAAMEVLDTFKGRKIVVTPGLVELGKMENVANLSFGTLLAAHADKVIVIGKHNAEMIINGLTAGGMDKADISFAKNLNKGNEILNAMLEEGDVVLFENDLPDNYS